MLFLSFKILSVFLDLAALDKVTFWAVNFMTIPIIVALSTFTFVHVEKDSCAKKREEQTDAPPVAYSEQTKAAI